MTQEQADALNSQITILESQLIKPKLSGEDYTNKVGFAFAVVAWVIYVLAGKAPTTSSKIGSGICAYFISLIWIMLSTHYLQKLFFRISSQKVAATLRELRNSGLYAKFNEFRVAQKRYEAWLEQVEKEREKEQEEWNRWQREWSKGKAPFWLNLDGISFEIELANLFKALGYEASLTSWSNDDGVDINLKKGGRTTIVQCKAHNKPVGSATVRELVGSLYHFKADEAILACIAGFTASAKKFAEGKPIKLIKLDDILRMQAALIKEMPAPHAPRNYQSAEKPHYSTHQPVGNTPARIPTLTVSQKQQGWTLALASFIGISFVVTYVVFTNVYLASASVPEKKIATAVTPTPIPYAPTPQIKLSPTPRLTPTPAATEEEIVDTAEATEYERPASITVTLPSPTPIPTGSPNITGVLPTNSSQTFSPPPTPAQPLQYRNSTYDDERRISEANDLKQLGVSVDWRAYTWAELYDMERRVRQAADLQQLGLYVNWRDHSWAEMYDWERRIREAEDLKKLGLTVNWRDHSWAEMYDWERRIRQANDLREYGIYVDWRNYTWSQMYEMELKARKK